MTSSNEPSIIVIDSNVWVSALVFGGMPRRVFELAIEQGISIATSEAIFTEVRRILHQKFPDFVDDFEALLVALSANIRIVTLGEVTVQASRDPDDNAVIETALKGQAPLVISGDKDLLVLKKHLSISFLTPAKFCKL